MKFMREMDKNEEIERDGGWMLRKSESNRIFFISLSLSSFFLSPPLTLFAFFQDGSAILCLPLVLFRSKSIYSDRIMNECGCPLKCLTGAFGSID